MTIILVLVLLCCDDPSVTAFIRVTCNGGTHYHLHSFNSSVAPADISYSNAVPCISVDLAGDLDVFSGHLRPNNGRRWAITSDLDRAQIRMRNGIQNHSRSRLASETLWATIH